MYIRPQHHNYIIIQNHEINYYYARTKDGKEAMIYYIYSHVWVMGGSCMGHVQLLGIGFWAMGFIF